MKIRPVGAELFHTDGRTDLTKLIVVFRNFACRNSLVGIETRLQARLPQARGINSKRDRLLFKAPISSLGTIQPFKWFTRFYFTGGKAAGA